MRSLDSADWRILSYTISLPELRRFFLIQLESGSKQETPMVRVLMGQMWLMGDTDDDLETRNETLVVIFAEFHPLGSVLLNNSFLTDSSTAP